MSTIDQLRRNLPEKTSETLSAILDYFLENGEWIPERALHAQFGVKEEVKALLNEVGGDAVFLTEEPNEGFRRYELSLLGALLTRRSEELEQLLADYLTFARGKALLEPKRVDVDSKEVEQVLRLDADQVRVLGWMLRRGYQFEGGGSYRDGGWTVRLPKNIEDIPEDTLLYVNKVVVEGYDAGRPIDPDERRIPAVGRVTGLTASQSQEALTDLAVLISPEIIEGTRDYLETVLRQVNGCYAHGHYDACAVMLRRLIETLIIECYETHGIADAIKDSSESFVGLDELIRRFLAQKKWNIGRNARRHLKELPSIKGIGDLSAHNRRFTATKNDIDRIANEARVAIQELATIAFGEN